MGAVTVDEIELLPEGTVVLIQIFFSRKLTYTLISCQLRVAYSGYYENSYPTTGFYIYGNNVDGGNNPCYSSCY